MTDLQHQLTKQMYRHGVYLRCKPALSGRTGYMFYSGNQNPERWFSAKTAWPIVNICKTDKDGRLTLNLNKVRQQHGKTLVKNLYKNQK